MSLRHRFASSLTGCSPARTTENGGAGTGWMRLALARALEHTRETTQFKRKRIDTATP